MRHHACVQRGATASSAPMEDLWLTWAKRLQAIASTGLHYTEGSY
ncbi:MAG: NUDIX hydrolase N-terminal domain-containing protein, partial [Gammaproteobacteria bacterium]|nr:NUDIX hydrolase N-terminal domain-containing protein [Gammaproteobacteria bacterium]